MENFCGCKVCTDALEAQIYAAKFGFDWVDILGVLEKTHEELTEIRHAIESGDKEHARRELGDLLFAVINLARFLQADPARELAEATKRFSNRFLKLTEEVAKTGRQVQDVPMSELDVIWEKIKK